MCPTKDEPADDLSTEQTGVVIDVSPDEDSMKEDQEYKEKVRINVVF